MDNQQMERVQIAVAAKPKASYVAPRLVALGALSATTLGNNGSRADTGNYAKKGNGS